MMEASHTDFNEAYAAVDRHQLGDFAPHIYRTRDLGRTWQEITRGLPSNGYVHTVKEDPVRRGLLFAGTERAVFVSFDSGDSWQSLQLNLPSTSMRDLEVHDTDLIIATHGRGFWVIDDMSVLRQVNSAMTSAAAGLFAADATAPCRATTTARRGRRTSCKRGTLPLAPRSTTTRSTERSGPSRILDASSAGRTISSDDPEPPALPPQNVGSLAREAKRAVGTAGHHRWVWDRDTPVPAAGRGRRPAPMLTGTFTVRLTANGQSTLSRWSSARAIRARADRRRRLP